MYNQRMAKRYSIAQARAALPAIIDAVQAGGEVEIARRGELVAVVMSPEARALGRASFSEAYASFLEDHDRYGLSERFITGLRDRSPGRKVRV